MSDQDSAIPQQLLDWSSWAQGQDGTLQRAATKLNQTIETFNTSGRSPGIVGSVPYAGNDGIAFAARNGATDQWVGQVGQAFLSIARSQLPPGVARLPDVEQSLAQGPVTTTDQKLASLVGDDPVQLAAKQAAAATMAAKLDEAIWTNNPAAIEALLQELAQHQNDPVFNSAFFKQLGPNDTLYLADQLGNPKFAGGDSSLQIFDQALASATNSADWDPSFNQALFATVDGGVVPYGAFYLLKYGVYSEDFLTTAGDAELKLGPDQRANDPQVAARTLAAIARNQQAALDFLTNPPAGWPAGGPSRLARILVVYGQDLRAGGSDPMAGAMANLVSQAGTAPQAPASEVQTLLQTLGEMPSQMVPTSLSPAIADVIANHIDLFVAANPQQKVNATWTWQEHVFQLAESNGTGQINPSAVSEIENSIAQWQLTHVPNGYSQQSSSQNEWTTYLREAGRLWGLAALPVRQAPYDATALQNSQVNAVSTMIQLIPFTNLIPAKHELLQLVAGDGTQLLESIGTNAATQGPGTDDQKAVSTYYQQVGAMRLVLATQFLSEHPDLVPQGADFNQYVQALAEGNAPAGNQTPQLVDQFRSQLDSAQTAFDQQYHNPTTAGS